MEFTRWLALAVVGLIGAGSCHAQVVGEDARPRVLDDAGNRVSEVSFTSGTSRAVVHLRTFRGLLFTDQVRIDGKACGWFLVDTGANFTMLDRQSVNSAALTIDKRLAPGGTPDQPDGPYRITSLAITDFSLKNHAIVVTDLSQSKDILPFPLAGIIGGDVWGAIPFCIDYHQQTMTLYERSKFKAPDQPPSEKLIIGAKPEGKYLFASANPLAAQPWVKGKVNGVDTMLLLDTGSTASVALTPDFAKAHPEWLDSSRPVQPPVSFVSGGSCVAARLDEVEFLNHRWVNVGGGLGLVGNVQGLGASEIPETAQTVGAVLLQNFCWTFDYATGRVWAAPSEAETHPS